jgi:sortase A
LNTNCVIAVHRGLGGSDFLRYVEKLETGDIVRVENFWYTLEYKVVRVKIIEPDEVKPILIQQGKDMLTLYTCHPYGVNSQRYLVYCERNL